jgi:hypothetical protein
MAQILTANRLVDGTVVYWRADAWVEAFSDAETFADEAAAQAALAAAKPSVTGNVVVNPYLLDLKDGRPAKEREIIRALGPSVRSDLGKQAAPGFAAADLNRQGDKDDDVSL